jgi:hypothetical protein
LAPILTNFSRKLPSDHRSAVLADIRQMLRGCEGTITSLTVLGNGKSPSPQAKGDRSGG